VSTSKLNDAIRTMMEQRGPSTPSGRRARVYYATQTDVAPPTVVLFVNNPLFFNETYQRYMINRFRELLPYGEVPIRLMIRGREGGGKPPATSLDDAGHAPRPPRPQKPSAKMKTSRPRRTQVKPHPKPAAKRGPARGTRPHR
jgi:GTP-binding protein